MMYMCLLSQNLDFGSENGVLARLLKELYMTMETLKIRSWQPWVKVFRITLEFRILRLTFHSQPQNAEFCRL